MSIWRAVLRSSRIIGPALAGLGLLSLYGRKGVRKARRSEQIRRLVKRNSDGHPTLQSETPSEPSVEGRLTGLYVMLTLSGAIWLVDIVALCRWLVQP
jgi:hypothetical protein